MGSRYVSLCDALQRAKNALPLVSRLAHEIIHTWESQCVEIKKSLFIYYYESNHLWSLWLRSSVTATACAIRVIIYALRANILNLNFWLNKCVVFQSFSSSSLYFFLYCRFILNSTNVACSKKPLYSPINKSILKLQVGKNISSTFFHASWRISSQLSFFFFSFLRDPSIFPRRNKQVSVFLKRQIKT